jgi:hypothetical protein
VLTLTHTRTHVDRFEDHMRTKVVDVNFVYSAQSLDRLKKKRNKYLDKLERSEVIYQRRKQKKETRDQAKSQDVGFWHRHVHVHVHVHSHSHQVCKHVLVLCG